MRRVCATGREPSGAVHERLRPAAVDLVRRHRGAAQGAAALSPLGGGRRGRRLVWADRCRAREPDEGRVDPGVEAAGLADALTERRALSGCVHHDA
ncbi:hypothetical protein MICRO8M_80149 [Microbacterium sp. 8M]|nr:hypothetical protein MICRO8M_80149 [Microbacterium sp. 8M]